MFAKVHADIEGLLQELDIVREVEVAEWDYVLPEQYQDEVEVQDYSPIEDKGWDYVLPEKYRY